MNIAAVKKSPPAALPSKRLNLSDRDQMQRLAGRLGITVVDLLGAVREVGTWIPAIEQRFSTSGIFSSANNR
jgi:Protein of unknown function (DUF3606)